MCIWPFTLCALFKNCLTIHSAHCKQSTHYEMSPYREPFILVLELILPLKKQSLKIPAFVFISLIRMSLWVFLLMLMNHWLNKTHNETCKSNWFDFLSYAMHFEVQVGMQPLHFLKYKGSFTFFTYKSPYCENRLCIWQHYAYIFHSISFFYLLPTKINIFSSVQNACV